MQAISRPILNFAFLVLSLGVVPSVRAQLGQEGYEDFGAFAGEPIELENEVSDIFGRFFQTNLQLGSSILTGGLGQAYSSGLLINVKFIFFFDKMWATELGAGFSRHQGYYNQINTQTAGIDLPIAMNLVPIYLGFRYGFDQERLARGFATMNPYVSLNGEIIFRNEQVPSSPIPDVSGLNSVQQGQFGPGAAVPSTGIGANFGGGIEFDVYRKRLFLGIDLRYHLAVWSNGNDFFGNLDRRGNYLTLMGSTTYNY